MHFFRIVCRKRGEVLKRLLTKYKTAPKHIKASFWFLICSFLQKGIMVIVTPIFTRIMSTQEYGQFGVFNSWMNIMSVFVTMNLFSGMYTRGLVKYENDKKIFSSSLQGLVLLLTSCWTIIYLCFQSNFNSLTSLTTTQTLFMLLLIWTSAAFSFWAAEQRVELRYSALVALTLCVSIIKPIVGIFLVTHTEDKVTARIFGLAMVELIFFTGCFISQVRHGKRLFSRKYWKEAILFNIPLIPHYLSMTVLNGADKIMIERIVGSAEAGVYNLAYQLSQVMMLFNMALNQTIEPWLYKKINYEETEDIQRVAYPSWAFIAVINLLLIALAPEIVAIFAPPEYGEAIWVVPPIAMSGYFIFQYAFFAVFEFYYEKTRMAAVATCSGALLNIILNAIFIDKFGYYAAGYTTLLCYAVYAMMHYVFMRKTLKHDGKDEKVYSSQFMTILSCAFLLCGFGLMTTYRHPLVRYALLISAFLVLLVCRKKLVSVVKAFFEIRGSRRES